MSNNNKQFLSAHNLTANMPGWQERRYQGNVYPVGILTGEGVGPELIETCIPLLELIMKYRPWRFDLSYGGKIGLMAKQEAGQVLTSEVMDFCGDIFSRGGAIFSGPGGGAFVYELRRAFDLYCKFAPIKPLPSLASTGPLKTETMANVDIVVVRENMGGLYQGESSLASESGLKVASHTFSYDEGQVSQILKVALKLAASRRGKLCVVHKPGGAPAISQLWKGMAEELNGDHGVELQFLEVDTAAYLMIAKAQEFDVVVTPNMFGDVLADAAALLLSSRGMSYSANYGDNGTSVYQTAHGAAYDIAGKGIANPLGQMQALAMMLHETFGLYEPAVDILMAIDGVLQGGLRTADIMEPNARQVSTSEMAEAVAQGLEERLKSFPQAGVS